MADGERGGSEGEERWVVAVTHHTTACCSAQVVDIILTKVPFRKISHPSEWYNRNIAGPQLYVFIFTNKKCTKVSRSSSVH